VQTRVQMGSVMRKRLFGRSLLHPESRSQL
jgi:hypothetical protein